MKKEKEKYIICPDIHAKPKLDVTKMESGRLASVLPKHSWKVIRLAKKDH